jgi:hypothetical protein
MSDDIIKRALGMDVPETVDDKAIIVYESEEEEASDQFDRDFQFVHDNLTELIAQGSEAIAELLMIAKQSQHPRAFEVIATLLKANADLNSDLLAAHKKKADLKGEKQATHSKGVAGITNNNLFVGSTAELQQFLEQQQNKKYESK